MDGPVAIAPEHFLSDRGDPPARGRPGDVEVVEAMRVEHAPLAVSSPDHHRCTASATPAVDGDLVVARQMVGLQTLEGGAAHVDEAPSGRHLGRRAPEVRVIGGERFGQAGFERIPGLEIDRKSTRLNSSHANISYAVFCLKKK